MFHSSCLLPRKSGIESAAIILGRNGYILLYCDFHCWTSASLMCLNLLTLGDSPVATPFASSMKPPIWVFLEVAY